MRDQMADNVLVEIVSVEDGREIAWTSPSVEKLTARLSDVKQAITEGTRAIVESLPDLPVSPDWRLAEVSACFGLTLAAEGGVIISKASASATFEVTVKFLRKTS